MGFFFFPVFSRDCSILIYGLFIKLVFIGYLFMLLKHYVWKQAYVTVVDLCAPMYKMPSQ